MAGGGRGPCRALPGRWPRRWLPATRTAARSYALARVDLEHPNLTAAIERSLAVDDATTAARLTWALWMYWWLRGHLTHGRRLAESVLDHELPAGVRARAELAAATMAFALDDVTAALRWWSAALDARGRRPGGHGECCGGRGPRGARRRRPRRRGANASSWHGRSRNGAVSEGEWTRALSLIWLGTVHLLDGDADGAVAHIEQGLASARARGDRLTSYIALYNLSQVELGRGDHARAREHLKEGVRLSRETGDHANLAYLLDASAVLEAARGTHARVPLLLGAAQTIRETSRLPRVRLLPARPGSHRGAPLARHKSISVRTGTTTGWTSDAASRPRKPRTSPWTSKRPPAETRTPPGHLAVSVVTRCARRRGFGCGATASSASNPGVSVTTTLGTTADLGLTGPSDSSSPTMSPVDDPRSYGRPALSLGDPNSAEDLAPERARSVSYHHWSAIRDPRCRRRVHPAAPCATSTPAGAVRTGAARERSFAEVPDREPSWDAPRPAPTSHLWRLVSGPAPRPAICRGPSSLRGALRGRGLRGARLLTRHRQVERQPRPRRRSAAGSVRATPTIDLAG